MPGYFTKIEVADPHLIPQSIWENIPPNEKALLTEREFSSQERAPADRRRFRIEPESFRTELSVANVGGLRATWIFSNGAAETTHRSPAVERFVIGLNERGASQLVLLGANEPVTNSATTGVIYGVEPRTRDIGPP